MVIGKLNFNLVSPSQRMAGMNRHYFSLLRLNRRVLVLDLLNYRVCGLG